MYDTRIPDAIDNALFVLLSLGFLAAEATAIVLVALVGGVQALATLFFVVISGGAGAFALARGKRG